MRRGCSVAEARGYRLRTVCGAEGGAAATVTMSAFLAAATLLRLLRTEPPRLIVRAALPSLPPKAINGAALAAHVAYGVGMGAGYGVMVPKWVRNPVTGVGYGVLVWAVSYAGWIPALGIMPPPWRDRRNRAVTMFLAHLVYGATLGASAGSR